MEASHNISFPYKICIPYQNEAKGGMYTFFTYFKKYLTEQNISYTENMFESYDFLIINSFMTRYEKILLRKIISPWIKIVHRIDGAAEDYGRGREWDQKQKKINRLCRLTIFQSQYGREATLHRFKAIVHDGPVIYNPIRSDLFNPHQKPGKTKFVYVTFSTNKKKGIFEFLQVAKENPDLDFIMIGNCPDELKQNLSNVEFTGLLKRDELAKKLGECHYFLFFSQNESCPNVILEAMASGLVVLYLDSGATKELVGETGFAITQQSFRNTFEKIKDSWPGLSLKARKRAEDEFSPHKIFSNYLVAMKALKEKKS